MKLVSTGRRARLLAATALLPLVVTALVLGAPGAANAATPVLTVGA